MLMPNIGIIITCYNKESCIKDAIDSAVAQTYENKAIIIVDDCSTDNSWNTIKSCVHQKDKYDKNLIVGKTKDGVSICCIRNENSMGIGFSKNVGINATIKNADAYMFLDANDTLFQTKVQICVSKWLEDLEAIGLIYTDQIIKADKYECKFYSPSFNKAYLERTDYIGSNYFITKKALILAGKYDEELMFPDYDMQLRVSENIMIVHIPEFLSKHTIKITKPEDIKNNYEKTIKKLLGRRR